jgi:hypothetical protein
MSWFWSQDQEKDRYAQKDEDKDALWDTVAELPNDPRLGKRVFCLSLLPDFETYGTLQHITRYSNNDEPLFRAVEDWRVHADLGMNIEGPSQCFELYAYTTEFQSGDHVRCDIDEGGYWEGIILRPLAFQGQVTFLIQIRNVQTKWGRSGDEEAHPPERLVKL